jgi:hypothetical protein
MCHLIQLSDNSWIFVVRPARTSSSCTAHYELSLALFSTVAAARTPISIHIATVNQGPGVRQSSRQHGLDAGSHSNRLLVAHEPRLRGNQGTPRRTIRSWVPAPPPS